MVSLWYSQAARVLHLSGGASLFALLQHYLPPAKAPHVLEYKQKQFALADWRVRPLPPELQRYARVDTHYLLYLADRLRADLVSRVCVLLSLTTFMSNVKSILKQFFIVPVFNTFVIDT